jgi:hypothetical protein
MRSCFLTKKTLQHGLLRRIVLGNLLAWITLHGEERGMFVWVIPKNENRRFIGQYLPNRPNKRTISESGASDDESGGSLSPRLNLPQ